MNEKRYKDKRRDEHAEKRREEKRREEKRREEKRREEKRRNQNIGNISNLISKKKVRESNLAGLPLIRNTFL